MPADHPRSIPITVIGGYLGSGKTTLLNALLREPGGRRLGVIVNDFGELGVDASLIAAASGSTVPIANLANGCVCCTLGDDLGATLLEMSSIEPALDHIVIEASGVADPAATAAWGTVPPFTPGGVVVLAAADIVQRLARDRYVGREVIRQLEGADLLIVTKSDVAGPERVEQVMAWLGEVSAAPVIDAPMGDVPGDVVLGSETGSSPRSRTPSTVSADDRYDRWAWKANGPIASQSLERFLEELPSGLLRLKGVVEVQTEDGFAAMLVQVVGTTISVTAAADVRFTGIEAIGVRGTFDRARIEAAALEYLWPA